MQLHLPKEIHPHVILFKAEKILPYTILLTCLMDAHERKMSMGPAWLGFIGQSGKVLTINASNRK